MAPFFISLKKDNTAKSSYGSTIASFIFGVFILFFIIWIIPYYNPWGLHDAIIAENEYLSSIGIILAIIMALAAIAIGAVAISRTRKR